MRTQEYPLIPLVKETASGSFEKWEKKYQRGWIVYYFSSEALKLGNTNNLAGFKNWYQSARPYLHPGLDGRLTLDEEAKRWGTPFDTLEFFEHAFAELRKEGDAQATARRLLQRYAPDGPGSAATADAWQEWWRANRDYLFFCDSGGGYWYLDPLAKKRGLPSSQLRGPKRASLSP